MSKNFFVNKNDIYLTINRFMVILKMSKIIFENKRSKIILKNKIKTNFIDVIDVSQHGDKFHGSPVTNGSERVKNM